ncbi:MAG: thioredoxin family protein [Candidatus Omnitrophica bacterium]|nr:thioredoxin family protein [Candidatus Omnitrophota bacterium]
MYIREIKDENSFVEAVTHNQNAVLVMFSQDGSSLCKKIEEVLENISKERPDLKVFKVDIKSVVSLASRYMVTTPPAIIAFRGGRPREKVIGLVSKKEIERLIQRQFS